MRLNFTMLFAVLFVGALAAMAQAPQPTRLHTGFQFTEGPAVDRFGNIFFSDVQRNRIHRIDTRGALTTFLENQPGVNGLMFDRLGRLIACQTGRVVAIDVSTGNVTVLATKFENTNFQGPNDLAVDYDGNIYFSDRPGNAVYFIATDGTVKRLITNLNLPNGVLLSTDDKTLYVLSSAAVMMAYPIVTPGQIGAPKTIPLSGTGGGDGLTIDELGNFCITRPSSNEIQLLASDGNSYTTISFPEAPSNCVIGGADGKTLFVTARTSVYTVPLQTKGYSLINPILTVSAASYSPKPLAVNSIATTFGLRLSIAQESAKTIPLPTTLAGTQVRIGSPSGLSFACGLLYVGPDQINFAVHDTFLNELPNDTKYTLIVTNALGETYIEKIKLARVSPALFTADASGSGYAAATALRVKANGAQSYEAVTRVNVPQNRIDAVPIDLGEASDQVYLILFGTGFIRRDNPSSQSCQVGGIDVPVTYAGAQGDLVGLNQVNILLPRALAGRGDLDVVLTIDGKRANTVRVNVK